MIACRHAKHAEVKLLLAAGASRYTRDSKGEDALHHAIVGTSLLCCRLILGTAPNWHYTPQQLSETNAAGRNALFAAVQAGLTEVCKLLIAAGMDRGNVHPSGSPSVYMFCDPEDRSIIGGFRSSLVRSFHELALHYWPRRLELADLFDPHGVPQPLAPPCCANCKTSDIKLSACSKCHAVSYCSTACQRADWRRHKPACISPEDVNAVNFRRYG
jgi:ankyrin repeat protein